ncbi:MAG: MBL fold metallo-hydrolase [Oscillospiraceae bacterium]|nr:MBL fold metallo-hydrolase [Oscillospiraceae bacterium]
MKVTFLGTGCAMVLKRFNTCFLLEEGENKLLVDAGGGNEVLVRLDRLGVSITEIPAMYVTHSHTDHILGTPWVIRAAATEMAENGYQGTFTIYACKETLAHVRTICEMILGKKMTKYFDKQILFREVEDGDHLELPGFDLTCFDIGSKKMKQFGFLLTLPNGEKVCFPGDEPVKESSEQYAQGAKWLFSEAYCLYEDRDEYQPYQRSHVTSLDAAQLAERLNAENLVIYHTVDYGPERRERMTNEAKTAYQGNVYVPEDMESLSL